MAKDEVVETTVAETQPEPDAVPAVDIEKLRSEIVAELTPTLRTQIEQELREVLTAQIREELLSEMKKKELDAVKEALVREYELNDLQIEVLNSLVVDNPDDLRTKINRLFGSQKKVPPVANQPRSVSEGEYFTLEQLKDPKFYRENKEAILKAIAENRVIS